MSDSEDARNSMRAAINQLPETMDATRQAFTLVGNLNRNMNRHDPHDEVMRVLSVLAVCLFTVENRLEKLEGRAGIPAENLVNLMREFGFEHG